MHTKRIILLIFRIGVIILFFSHCEEKEPVRFFITEAIKDYGDFKVGSYWVYQIDSGNNEDSIWVASRTLGNDEEVIDKKVVSLFEKITINCKGNTGIYDYIDIRTEKQISYLAFGQIDSINNIRYGMTFFYKDSFISYPSIINSIIFHKTFSLNGKSFINVLYRKDRRPILDILNYSKEFDTLEYWIAKDIGVIKKTIRNKYGKRTYSLKRYSVIR